MSRHNSKFRNMRALIENEGFDYYFLYYTSYENCGVKDLFLKKLWLAFEKSAKDLSEYVGMDIE